MSRDLKTLGLALLATLALSVATAPAARGEQAKFTGDTYPLAMTGHVEGPAEGANYFELTPGWRVECDKATYEALLFEETTQLTFTAHYSSCATTTGVSVTIDLNGCHFQLAAGTATFTEETDATTDVKCPPGKQIVITAGACKVDIPPQEKLPGITITNRAAGEETPEQWFTIDMAVTNLHYVDTDAASCAFVGDTTGSDGQIVSSLVVKGYEWEGWHAHPSTAERLEYTTGEPWGVDVKIKNFSFEPAVITGHEEQPPEAEPSLEFTSGWPLECEEVTYEARRTLESNVTLKPHYAGCTTAFGIAAVVNLNGCDFLLEVGAATSATETHGSMRVACPTGKQIVITAGPCKIDIPAQGPLTGITFTNEPASGETPKPWVTVDMDVSELHYNDTDGFLCPFTETKTASDGNFVADLVLRAYKSAGADPHPTTAGKVQYTHGEESGIDL